MSLLPADVSGYKKMKGFCFIFNIEEGFYKRISAKQCAKRCNDREECRAFQFDNYYKECDLKPSSCKTPSSATHKFFYERCKSFQADMMFFIFCG